MADGPDLTDMAEEKEEREETESRSKAKSSGKKNAGAAASSKTSSGKAAEQKSGNVKTLSAKSMRKAIMAMVEENSDEDEWFPLGDLGNLILKRYPDFDVRNFGFKKFTPFIKSLGVFEFKEERVPGSNNKLIYIREKQEKQDKAPQPAPVPVQTPDTAVSGTGLASFLERPTWSKKKLEL